MFMSHYATEVCKCPIPEHSLSVVMTVPYGLRSSKRTITITTIKPEILPQASVKSIVAVPTDITMP